MRLSTLAAMQCPYCEDCFEVSKVCEQRDDRLVYGLIRCSCFQFPVLDGILLLGLVKAYGGAEEELAPYVPIQAAAISCMQAGDLPGLKSWLARHCPLVSKLIEQDVEYFEFMREHNASRQRSIATQLQADGKYEFIGRPNSPEVAPVTHARQDVRDDYYVTRFTNAFALPALAECIADFPLSGRVLSLCCGHGIFELLLAALEAPLEVVSIDGQLLNLLVTKNYINPGGDYICHDLQLPLPFPDATFDVSFDSTCLPELPSQAQFVRQQVRATKATGWSMVNQCWWADARIAPERHYRYLQNQHDGPASVSRLIDRAAIGRKVYATWVPMVPYGAQFPEPEGPFRPEWVEGISNIDHSPKPIPCSPTYVIGGEAPGGGSLRSVKVGHGLHPAFDVSPEAVGKDLLKSLWTSSVRVRPEHLRREGIYAMRGGPAVT